MLKKQLKSKIVRSPLHRPLKNLLAVRDKRKINKSRPELTPTVYVLSPYKTGTTYIDSLWEDSISRHEPCQVYSLRFLDENFDANFKKRTSYLNLKMECSGFLSLYLNKLPEANSENKIQYFYILRPPSKWVQSVLSHFTLISDLGYNFIDQFYWHKLLGYSMVDVLKAQQIAELEKLVKNLYRIYFELLETAFSRKDIQFVQMKDLDDFAQYLGNHFQTPPNYSRSWKRKSKSKFDKVEVGNESKDREYTAFVGQISQDRIFPFKAVNDV